MNPVDLILRRVGNCGWLYIIVRGGQEVARGEFKRTPAAALAMGLDLLARIESQEEPDHG